MGRHRKPFRPSNEDAYEVGYGRPPRDSRWKVGQPSPNPSGKRKGVKNRATLLHEFMQGKVTVIENGKQRKVTRAEALDITEYTMAMKGNIRALVDLRTELMVASRAVKATVIEKITKSMTDHEAAEAYSRMLKNFDVRDE